MADHIQTHVIPRDLLAKYFHEDPRLMAAFENQALAVMESQDGLVAATGSIASASVVTLSPNDDFDNEFVLGNGSGTTVVPGTGTVKIDVDKTVARATNFGVQFQPPGDVALGLPAQGTLLSDASPASLTKPKMTGLVNAATDSAAASAGVLVGGIYHNAGALRIRLV